MREMLREAAAGLRGMAIEVAAVICVIVIAALAALAVLALV
ncbi:MAG TPA: hypothetical protein VMS74_01635 [Acidimicrobiia bacterium]|nr:hypothetical protein [Acidimicrobiia bacterium]